MVRRDNGQALVVEMHTYYTFGTNSRVRAKRARQELGWNSVNTSAQAWIEQSLVHHRQRQ
jgi:hypothetical protein